MSKSTRVVVVIALAIVVIITVFITGCVHRSGGTWMIKEAPLPEGWPALTPVGEVAVRTYPVYRAAVVEDDDVPAEQGPMFNTLFDHIKRNDIAMTTPVEMGYGEDDGDRSQMTSMAFIYRKREWGAIGTEGAVEVRDIQPQTMASIGVRGDYTDDRFTTNLATLNEWLDARADQYRVAGPPRYLGYNGPFTLPFMRYGEVQLPVEERETDAP